MEAEDRRFFYWVELINFTLIYYLCQMMRYIKNISFFAQTVIGKKDKMENCFDVDKTHIS